MSFKEEKSRHPANAEYHFIESTLSDEDREILAIMGPEGLRIKYELKKEEKLDRYPYE